MEVININQIIIYGTSTNCKSCKENVGELLFISVKDGVEICMFTEGFIDKVTFGLRSKGCK